MNERSHLSHVCCLLIRALEASMTSVCKSKRKQTGISVSAIVAAVNAARLYSLQAGVFEFVYQFYHCTTVSKTLDFESSSKRGGPRRSTIVLRSARAGACLAPLMVKSMSTTLANAPASWTCRTSRLRMTRRSGCPSRPSRAVLRHSGPMPPKS